MESGNPIWWSREFLQWRAFRDLEYCMFKGCRWIWQPIIVDSSSSHCDIRFCRPGMRRGGLHNFVRLLIYCRYNFRAGETFLCCLSSHDRDRVCSGLMVWQLELPLSWISSINSMLECFYQSYSERRMAFRDEETPPVLPPGSRHQAYITCAAFPQAGSASARALRRSVRPSRQKSPTFNEVSECCPLL